MVIMAQVNFGVYKAMDDKKDKEGVVQWTTRRVSGSGTEPSANRLAVKQSTPHLSLNVIATKQTVGPAAERRNPSILRSLASNPLFEIPAARPGAGAFSEETIQHEGQFL